MVLWDLILGHALDVYQGLLEVYIVCIYVLLMSLTITMRCRGANFAVVFKQSLETLDAKVYVRCPSRRMQPPLL